MEHEINESYYEEDSIMAKLGRDIFDQYIHWCRKYGEPKNLTGWPSFVKRRILESGLLDCCPEDEICPKCCDHHANTGIMNCYNCGAEFE